jgi:hypothetical protein
MNLLTYSEQLYGLLGNRDNNVIIMAVFLCVYVLTVILRVIVYMHFRTLLLRFKVDIKEISKKEDIKKLKFGLLKRLIADYIRIAEKNANRIPTDALVQRQMAGISLIGWRYASVMPFIEKLETSLLWVGLILAVVFDESAIIYGTLTASGFLLTRLAAGFFDFREVRDMLAGELLIYTEREIGTLFPIEAGLAAAFPKRELTEAMEKIGYMMTEAVEKRLADVNAVMTKPMEDWGKALASAGNVQQRINEAAIKIQEAAQALASPMGEHGRALSLFAAEQDTLLKHAKLVEQNQHALEAAYQSYEASLQGLVQSLGDGLGAYLKMHGQTAAQAVNDALAGNMEMMMSLLKQNLDAKEKDSL